MECRVSPRSSYICQFTESVTGPSPTLHLDTVTAEASPATATGPLLYDSARALVLIFTPGFPDSEPMAIPVSYLWLTLALIGLTSLLARRALRR